MSDVQDRFERAAAKSKTLSSRPDNATLLRIYSLYKQGSSGDVTGEQPGFIDIVGRAKYDAWAELKGKSQEEAMQDYIALIDRLAEDDF
jgi:diazepam-binding inhibitor (GABA receptor modulating acyl-CoA-binding protein)